MRNVVKIARRLALILAVLYLAVRALVTHYYQDVTTCFEQGEECDTVLSITIHHDAIPLKRKVRLRDIDKFHEEVRKYSCGFAYNYYIAPDKIYKIRYDKGRGAHVLNGNTANIGICLHGNFDVDYPTLKQQILLICLVNYLANKYGVSKSNIKLHRDWKDNNTSCCGKHFDKDKFLKYIITK